MTSKPVVGYWDYRGLGEPIRLLLKYAGVDFEDKRYSLERGYKDSEWCQLKSTLGFDFPNLPYYIDDDVKLTQSLTILRYLAHKYKLDGTTEEELNRISLLEQQELDLTDSFYEFVKKIEPTAAEKEEFSNQLSKQLEQVNKFLGTGKYVAGELSYVDFRLYEYLHWVESSSETSRGVLVKFDSLKQYLQRIEMLPHLESYLETINGKID